MAKNDGGSAFPAPDDYGADGSAIYGPVNLTGMSLRDWFAGMAMKGLITDDGYASPHWPSNLVEDAYKTADAMLKARDK